MCSRKWAVPLVRAHSEREPASIQAPTVAVWALGFDSVATVRPLGSIVTCVRGCTLAPGLFLGPTWRVAAVASVREASGTRRLPLIEFARNRRADITTMWGRPRKYVSEGKGEERGLGRGARPRWARGGSSNGHNSISAPDTAPGFDRDRGPAVCMWRRLHLRGPPRSSSTVAHVPRGAWARQGVARCVGGP